MACENWSCSGYACQGGSSGGGVCSSCAGGGCTGWCSTGCLDSGGDSGGCGDCTKTCADDCENGCKDKCGKGCNTGCTTQEARDLFTSLALNKKIYAADMKNINRMIEIEASERRYNKTITTVKFENKKKAQSSQVKQLQDNLKAIGQTPKKDAGVKVKAWKTTGQELIDLVLDSADNSIYSSSTS